MDDSDVTLMHHQKEVNGNLSMESSTSQQGGKDEVDSPRAFLSPGDDDIDGCSRSRMLSIRNHVCTRGLAKDSEDDGYCSQDQIGDCHRLSETSPRKDLESYMNNNLNMSMSRDTPHDDATGKVFGVRMPPRYAMRSDERGTTFRPNLNEISSSPDDNVGVCIQEIPSRHTQQDGRIINENSVQRQLSVSEVQPRGNDRLCDGHPNDNERHTNINNQKNHSHVAGPQRSLNGRQSSDDAGRVKGYVTSRKRKGRDEEDGDDVMAERPIVSDTKRFCGGDSVGRRPVQAPLARNQPAGPTSRYDIEGQNNWVIQGAQDCTFHVYNVQNGKGGESVQHFVDWAGVSIGQVQDAKLRKAFEETSEAISNAFDWKRFARRLPVSRSPKLEKELRALESCIGSAEEKALAVLLRWWREECSSRYGDDVNSRLKEGLEDCGLKRMARNVEKIFK